MSLLDDLREKLKKERSQPSLKRLLRKQTGCSSRNIFIRDRHIDPITDDEFDEYLETDKSFKIKWREEMFDCDDISLLFLVHAKGWFMRKKDKNAGIGWIWAYVQGENHAFIFYIRKEDLRCIFFKPQLHKRFELHARPSLMIV